MCCEKKGKINTYPLAVRVADNASTRKPRYCLSHKAIKKCFAMNQCQRSALARSQKARTATSHFAPHFAAKRAPDSATVLSSRCVHGGCPHDWYEHHSLAHLDDTLR